MVKSVGETQITNNGLDKLPVVWPGRLAHHRSEGWGIEGGGRDERALAGQEMARGSGKQQG